jgi:uncharacterized protein YecT (DUF1311 family)
MLGIEQRAWRNERSKDVQGSMFQACPERSEGSFVAFVTDPWKLRMRGARTSSLELWNAQSLLHSRPLIVRV